MVVAAHPLAADAGREVLAEGGNAVEAAVAVSLALGVVEPMASGLGGGGFMMISPSGAIGRTEVLDARGKLSSLFAEDYIYPKKVMLPWVPKIGPMSATVPGLGRMLGLALQKYGRKISLQRLAKRAINLASDGFEVGDVFLYCSSLFESTVRSSPECAKIFYNNGVRYKPGERLVQKDLARTLRLVAERGFEVCYTGEVGLALTRAANSTGPVWGRDDLAKYEVKVRPRSGRTSRATGSRRRPPPSRGGAGILQTLLRYDKDPIKLAKTIRTIFRELDPVIGDPDVFPIDLSKLTEGPKGPTPGGGRATSAWSTAKARSSRSARRSATSSAAAWWRRATACCSTTTSPTWSASRATPTRSARTSARWPTWRRRSCSATASRGSRWAPRQRPHLPRAGPGDRQHALPGHGPREGRRGRAASTGRTGRFFFEGDIDDATARRPSRRSTSR
jgi:hypothetical protein